MASDPPPADFGVDDEDESKTSDSMYVSAVSPSTNVPLGDGDDDDDDDDPFGTNQPSIIPSTPSATSAQVPTSPSLSQPSSPIVQQSQLYPTNLNVDSPPSSPSTTYASQTSPSAPEPKYDYSEAATASKPPRQRINEGDIEITVSDPTKVGSGMSSYMTYRIATKTSLSIFTKPEFTVSRRFSDFLGLHGKLVQKYLHAGVFIPTPPEKDTLLMAKVKTSKDDAIPTDFIDRRRALLERYLNRLARHGKLIEDPDVREFLELPSDLPKSKETAAISTAGASRALTAISNSVAKLTTKTGEQDQWFEEKQTIVVDLQVHLKHVYSQFNALFGQRKEAGQALKQFSTSLNHLATNEEHPSLSKALLELANLKEKLDQINNEHSYKEYSILTELVKEYISLLDMIQLGFVERIKIHQNWLNAEETLRKKREAKTKLEQSPKGADKLPTAEMEIKDWEKKVEDGKEEFERVSTTIKEEMEAFEEIRIEDFKKGINDYLNNLMEQQEKILQIWEGYLPEANQITV